MNHCEFITMKQNPTNGKYILQNELRTWSDLRKRAAANGPANGSTPTQTRMTPTSATTSSPTIPTRRWGGCVNGCNHDKMNWPRRVMRKNTADFVGNQPSMPPLPPATLDGEKDDHPIASQEADHTPTIKEPVPTKPARKASTKASAVPAPPLTPASPNDASDDLSTDSSEEAAANDEEKPSVPAPRNSQHPAPRTAAIMRHLHPRGPSESIAGEGFSDDSDYFPGMHHLHHHHASPAKSRMRANSKARQQSKERKATRKNTEKGWIEQSGMGLGARADTLGDGDELSDVPAAKTVSPTTMEGGENLPLLRDALKGDMIVENSEGERAGDEESNALEGKKLNAEDIDKMKADDRKSLSEVY